MQRTPSHLEAHCVQQYTQCMHIVTIYSRVFSKTILLCTWCQSLYTISTFTPTNRGCGGGGGGGGLRVLTMSRSEG